MEDQLFVVNFSIQCNLLYYSGPCAVNHILLIAEEHLIWKSNIAAQDFLKN